MWWRTFRTHNIPIKFTARCSTSEHSLKPITRWVRPQSMNKPIFHVIKQYGVNTGDRVWFLVNELHNKPDPTILRGVLRTGKLSPDEFSEWQEAAMAPDFDTAMKVIEQAGIHVTDTDVGPYLDDEYVLDVHQPPTWLVLHLLANKVQTPSDAIRALSLTYHHLLAAPSHQQPCLLVLILYWLAELNVQSPMRQVVQTFLQIPGELPDYQFRALLQSISCASASKETSLLAATILEAMAARSLRLCRYTYNSLLSPEFVTVPLAGIIERRMQDEGFVPRVAHLRVLLRLMASSGRRRYAAKYLNAIRALKAARNAPVPFGTDFVTRTTTQIAQTPTTEYISSMRRSTTFVDYISRLLFAEARPVSKKKKKKAVISDTTGKAIQHASLVGRSVGEVRADKDDVVSAEAREGADSTTVVNPTAGAGEGAAIKVNSDADPLPYNRAVSGWGNVVDWTVALYVASRDPKTNADALMEVFERVKIEHEAFIPNIVTYTVLVRGLLYRHDYLHARRYWNVAVQQIGMDGMSLQAVTVGAQALIHAGEPHKAFSLLEDYNSQCKRNLEQDSKSGADGSKPTQHDSKSVQDDSKLVPDDSQSILDDSWPVSGDSQSVILDGSESVADGLKSVTDDPNSASGNLQSILDSLAEKPEPYIPRQVPIDVRCINVIMTALQRMGRPDAVLELWDQMETLYGVLPDVYTLSIVLKTAHLMGKFDNSLRGVATEFGFGAFVNPGPLKDLPDTATPRERAVYRMQQLFSPTQKHIVTGRWKGESAGLVMVRMTQRIFLSNWPQLHNVEMPAHALRPSGDYIAASPIGDLYLSTRGTHEVSLPLPAYDSDHRYLNILPDDPCFRAYIDLLAATETASEIPRAFVWMRMLGVRPSVNTTARALIHWGEVTLRAPLVEHFANDGKRDQYLRLKQWLMMWLGSEHMPDRSAMARAIRDIQVLKDKQYKEIAEHWHAGDKW